jgi:filamentous hemagglutinin
MARVFPNLFPNEQYSTHTEGVLPSFLLRVRGAQWFDYVVLEHGNLQLGERVVGQGHANLATGRGVLAAGQVQVSGGRIIQIDNASGHYLPTGPEARSAALDAFRANGFQVQSDVYVEKVWNPSTLQWEPANASNP